MKFLATPLLGEHTYNGIALAATWLIPLNDCATRLSHRGCDAAYSQSTLGNLVTWVTIRRHLWY